MNDDDLKFYDEQGFIPGPHETEEAFLRRVDYCSNLKPKLPSLLPGEIATLDSFDQEPLLLTKKLFNIHPSWVLCVFSNDRLMPWQGGAAWIFQMTEDCPLAAFFQIRQAFKAKNSYLGIYSRNELIAHELAHVGRMAFDEPIYEEYLAYRTSPSFFRRWFGPIIESFYESLFFVLLLGGIIVLDIAFVLMGQQNLFHTMSWLKLIPLALFLIAIIRLFIRHERFNKCLGNLKMITDRPNAFIYRLTDSEINEFSKMASAAIAKEIQQNKNTTLRHRLLANYLRDI